MLALLLNGITNGHTKQVNIFKKTNVLLFSEADIDIDKLRPSYCYYEGSPEFITDLKLLNILK